MRPHVVVTKETQIDLRVTENKRVLKIIFPSGGMIRFTDGPGGSRITVSGKKLSVVDRINQRVRIGNITRFLDEETIEARYNRIIDLARRSKSVEEFSRV